MGINFDSASGQHSYIITDETGAGPFILTEQGGGVHPSATYSPPKLTLAMAQDVALVLKNAGLLGGNGVFAVSIYEDSRPVSVYVIPAG